jgi:SAM-dependent MidA family methyltransferase
MEPAGLDAVAAAIAGAIERDGPMRFDRYMELALAAYYDVPPVGTGPSMDFATSPHVHPVFARLVAEAVRDLHEAIGRPERFDLIEAGSGDGTLLGGLMADITDLEPRVTEVERSAGARELLGTLGGVTVAASMPDTPYPVIVVANELLDNLPFRRFEPGEDGPREVHVGLDEGRFVEVLLPLTDLAPDGEATVASTGAAAFVVETLAGPGPRILLAIDYGSDAGAGGPAHGYAGHRVVSDLVARPGSSDITAGVDFGAVAAAALTAGLQTFPTVSQLEALTALGLEDWLATELEHQREQLDTGRGADAVRTWGGRSAATLLVDPAGLGRFRWFVAATPGVAEPAFLRAARRRPSASEA